jgi:hypothetical protein
MVVVLGLEPREIAKLLSRPKMEPEAGFEPTTPGLESRCSVTMPPFLSSQSLSAFTLWLNNPSVDWLRDFSHQFELLGNKMAPHTGFEPVPESFRDFCSTVELMRREEMKVPATIFSSGVRTYVGVTVFIME